MDRFFDRDPGHDPADAPAAAPDEAAPGAGAAPRPDADGEDPWDAARRAAGADPAAQDTDALGGPDPGILPPPD